MISERRLKVTVVITMLALFCAVVYAWYLITAHNLPVAVGACLTITMVSMYVMGLTFDRYRRSLYKEAMRLYEEEHVRAESYIARIHVRDTTIRLQTADLDRYREAEKQNLEQQAEIERRLKAIIDNLQRIDIRT